MSSCARCLHNNPLAYRFLTDALGIPNQEASTLSSKISSVELLLNSKELKSTLIDGENRQPLFSDDSTREMLREKIFQQLITTSRLADDEDIKLGKGGARPQNSPSQDKQAFMVLGLPASGKSTVSNVLADEYNAFLVDSDYAKRMLPEFSDDFGASIVHQESTLITFGLNNPKYQHEKNLYEYCISQSFNMILPQIGNNHSNVRDIRDSLISKGYDVHLVLISLDRKKSCIRALERYRKTNRYISLGYIFDVCANDPILSYYRVKNDQQWSSFCKISTDTQQGSRFELIETFGISPANPLQERGVVS